MAQSGGCVSELSSHSLSNGLRVEEDESQHAAFPPEGRSEPRRALQSAPITNPYPLPLRGGILSRHRKTAMIGAAIAEPMELRALFVWNNGVPHHFGVQTWALILL
jgi:hypothetical protein